MLVIQLFVNTIILLYIRFTMQFILVSDIGMTMPRKFLDYYHYEILIDIGLSIPYILMYYIFDLFSFPTFYKKNIIIPKDSKSIFIIINNLTISLVLLYYYSDYVIEVLGFYICMLPIFIVYGHLILPYVQTTIYIINYIYKKLDNESYYKNKKK